MKTIDVSGMGGSYENECQKMLHAGIEWLKESPGPIEFKQFKNVYGVIDTSENERAQKLEAHIVSKADDCTGAMVQCVMGHLWFIANKGINAWLAEFVNYQDRIFDWDRTVQSCPKTDISLKMDQEGAKQ